MAANYRKRKLHQGNQITLLYVTSSTSRNLASHISSTAVKKDYEINGPEYKMLQIIDNITNRISLDIVINEINNVITTINDRVSALKAIQEIEEKIIGVIVNIAQRVPLGIIIDRIDYIRNLVLLTPDFIEVYEEINNIILEIIDMITNNIDLPTVIKSLESINSVIQEKKQHTDMMDKIEVQLVSIIENITNRVPLEIVKDRIINLITNIKNLLAGVITSV
jgi:hypothetical protein